MRRHYKVRATGKNNDLSHVPSKRNEEIKSGTSGCGSFVVPYFKPATSTTDRLQREAGREGRGGGGGGGGRSLPGKRRYREKKTENKQHSFFARPQGHRGMMRLERNPLATLIQHVTES